MILIVSQNAKHAGELQGILQSKLYFETTVFNGQVEALVALLKISDAQLVMVDNTEAAWPFAETISLCKKHIPTTPVMVLINYGDTSAEQRAMDAGADEVMCRPCTIERLLLSVRNMLKIERLQLQTAAQYQHSSKAATLLLAAGTLPLLDMMGEMRKLRHIEADTIRFALRLYQGRIAHVARVLGIGRSTLYRKIDELGLNFTNGFGKTPPAYGNDYAGDQSSRANQTTLPTIRVSSTNFS